MNPVEDVLSDLIDEFTDRLNRGESPDLDEYLTRCPERRDELRGVLAMLVSLQSLRSGVLANETPIVGADSPTLKLSESTAAPAVPGFEILDEIGRGGMGVVYRARQVALNRIVALKMILAGDHAAQDVRTRFLAEAEIVARLDHPHIVRVHEFGSHEGRPFFALEYLSGGSLDRVLADGPLTPSRAAKHVAALARAVAHAHASGVIHRDLKPANVLLAPDGTAKVTDFGLAKQLDSGHAVTATGAVLGTPSYIAPEQIGDGTGTGPAVDTYSLGAILYECLTGRPPFRGATPLDTLAQVRDREPVPVRALQPSVPRDLETICMKCLRKEPSQRYTTAGELADDLDRFLGGRPVLARPLGAFTRGWRWCRRNRTVAILGGSVAVLLLGLTFGSILAAVLFRESQSRAEKAEADTERQLWQSLREQARATRTSNRPGQRVESLAALGRASAIAHRLGATPDELAMLRDEVIASLTLPDIEPGPEIPTVRPELETAGGRLAMDPDYRLVAIPEAGAIRIHSLDDGALRSRVALTEPTLIPSVEQRCVLLSVGGTYLAVYSEPRKEVTVYETATGRVLVSEKGILREHIGVPVAFFASGDRVAIGAADQTVRVIELPSAKETTRFPLPGRIATVAPSPDGRRLAAWCYNAAEIHILPLDGAVPRVLPIPREKIDYVTLSWHPHGRWLATSGGPNHSVALWDADSGEEITRTAYHQSTVWAISFHPNGQLVATTAHDNTTCVWNIYARRPDLRLSHQLGHPWFSADGRFCGYVPGLTSARLMRFHPAPECVRGGVHRGSHFPTIAVSPDGRIVLEQSVVGLHLWDRESGRWLGRLGTTGGGNGTVDWASDGSEFVHYQKVGEWSRWPVRPDGADGVRIGPPIQFIWGGRGLDHMTYHPDGKRLVRHSGAVSAVVADPPLASGPARPLSRSSGYFTLHPSGLWAATSWWLTPDVFIRNVESGTTEHRLPTGAGTLSCFTPDGKHLITTRGHAVTFWSTESWTPTRTIERLGGSPVASVSFTADGTILAVEEATGIVTLSSYPDGQLLCRLESPNRESTFFNRGMQFTPDGGALVCHAFAWHGFRVWDLHAIRSRLAALGLDWNGPSFPPPTPSPPVRRIIVVGTASK